MGKIWSCLLIVLVLIICSGCSETNNGKITNNTTAQMQDSIHYDAKLGKYVPPVNMYTVGSINPDMKFKNGENLENNIHTNWAEERLGIRIRYLWTIHDSNGAYANKLRIELAKGNMPDIVTIRERDVIQELIDSGQFREIGDLFEKYASPVWKSAMKEDPAVWDSFVRDGKKYAIPILDYQYSTDPVLWIRQDWLDKLKLPVPRTIEDLEAVMEAFTNKDPDGNGKNDTFGLTIGLRNGPSTWMADSSWIFGAFGIIPKQWNLAEDGKLKYGSVQPGAKDALRVLKKWIQKGYVSKESEWYNETKAADLFIAGKAGIIAGPYWMSGWPLSDLLKNDPKVVIKAIPIPNGPSGFVGRRGTLPVNGAILINKKMKDPEIFFKYQNYLFDYYATSTGEFAQGLARDYDWTVVNGVPSSDAALIPGGAVRVSSYTLTFDGARIPSKVIDAIPKDITPELFSPEGASMKEAFTGPPTTTMKSKWELLQKLEQQTFQEFLFNSTPESDIESFVKKWFAYGGDKITQEVNDWYRDQRSR
ncbi:extracellular solute-binding protein [Paenibacillus ferrarius]|uniref:extracellular solute-binding protein n=1 Tax=Paenibacillus ferrarius TaxID=1469647 RepID=UPI00117E27FE|nr:extracellular solute-binding protein [Paenibacillus ferrarius]